MSSFQAEQVVLERQIKHHELHQDHSSADHTSGASSSAEDISDSDDLPQLRLDISDSVYVHAICMVNMCHTSCSYTVFL